MQPFSIISPNFYSDARLRIAESLFGLLSLFPTIWLLGIGIFFLRARIWLGSWPYLYHPDPKSLPFPWSYSILRTATHVLPLSFLVVSTILLLFKDSISPPLKRMVMQGLFWGLLLFYWSIFLPAPGNFILWFLD